jgi:hypothetical protein
MEPIDIWRSAKLMVQRHRLFAPQECQRRADELAAQGDVAGAAVWDAVKIAAESLIEHGPPQDIPGLPS